LQKLVGWTVNTPAVPGTALLLVCDLSLTLCTGSIKLLPLPTKKNGDSRPKALQVPL
jgi:hypothetical protein